jgi:hypothetical protein
VPKQLRRCQAQASQARQGCSQAGGEVHGRNVTGGSVAFDYMTDGFISRGCQPGLAAQWGIR